MTNHNVYAIYITARKTEEPVQVSEARAVPGKGLEGDRYFDGQGTFPTGIGRGVTLIEIEAITALKRESGIELKPGRSRRNIVTEGVALNHLVNKIFYVGAVQLKGIRLCEPCAHLEQLTTKGVHKGLIHRGGLRAEVLSEGIIHEGDSIQVC